MNVIEEFSTLDLSPESAPGDVLGAAYEYLLKYFADESGKKAGEFFTPRSVVRLLTLILDPKEGESVHDPACGSGGMLVEMANVVREHGGDARTLQALRPGGQPDDRRHRADEPLPARHRGLPHPPRRHAPRPEVQDRRRAARALRHGHRQSALQPQPLGPGEAGRATPTAARATASRRRPRATSPSSSTWSPR